ncbi:EAL domain-containing protein [Thiorhodovibrio winogradskyi]|uniref:EAL domain-containing protein n=1 Tax=Thiorhodovibrio winogradskyi TaxID=77007 RepID=UPI002E2D88C1|nr:EAL domain-containing protein [Thiorhodovibrio winogradskyi]
MTAARVGTYQLVLSDGLVHGDAQFFRLLGLPLDTRPNTDPNQSTSQSTVSLEAFQQQLNHDDRYQLQNALDAIRHNHSKAFELCFRIPSDAGKTIPVLDRGRVFREDGRLLIAGALVDLTGFVAPVQQFQHLTSHDPLTGLLSRHGIWRLVEQAHQQTHETKRECAIALLDVDHLKDINDMHGPTLGDRVLSALAERLHERLRPKNITIGRWGGDEFLAVAADTDEAALVQEIDGARQMLAEKPLNIDGQDISVTLSAGVTSARRLMDSTEQALARADVALYRAKKDGYNRVYGGSTGAGTDNRTLSLAILVQDAVRTARVTPVFQPVVRLRDRQPVAEEAFSRIMENGSRLLNASAFIEVALQLKLLHRIDHMLFEAAMERIAYPPSNSAFPPRDRQSRPIFVHVSEDLIQHPATLNDMINALDGATLPEPLPLVLVLNEQTATEHKKMVADTLKPLLDLGCKLSVSGYGTRGHSLQLLHQDLPINFLSIDPFLVQKALESDRARSVIAELQQSARGLGITTIAKQVQNPATLNLAIELGLDWGQGYLLGVPTDPSWPLSARSDSG